VTEASKEERISREREREGNGERDR